MVLIDPRTQFIACELQFTLFRTIYLPKSIKIIRIWLDSNIVGGSPSPNITYPSKVLRLHIPVNSSTCTFWELFRIADDVTLALLRMHTRNRTQ